MKRFFSMSIRAQLFLMAFVVAVPAAGIIIYSGLDQRNKAMLEARTETRKLADNIAAEQQELVASTKQLMSTLAQLPEIKRQDTAKVQTVLSDILALNPQYLNIFIVDRAGIMWVSARPSKERIPVTDRRHFINARATGRFSSGECIIGRLLGKPTLSFGYPYKDQQGEFAGVIVANFDLEQFCKLLERAKLPAGSSFLILDHKGMILSRGINPAELVGKQYLPKRFRNMQEGPGESDYTVLGMDGLERISHYHKLYLAGEQTPYMYVLASIPVKGAFASANKALFLNLALLAPFMMAAFVLAWVIGKRSIVDRVSILREVAQRLTGGDLQARVSHRVTGGELGELGCALDTMAGALASDIAERKRTEEEISLLNKRLCAHAAELEAANRELEAFNYTVSHDLRSPLTNLNCLSSLLIETSTLGQDGKGRRYLDQIREEGRRMEQLINTLLDFSRLTHCELNRERINLSEIVRVLALELKLENPERCVEFIIREEVTVTADPRLMQIAVENLVGNAWKYSVKQEKAIIEFGVTGGGEGQACFVRDNGMGFDMKDADRLFGTFQRLHDNDDFEGYGIGLATVQRIITRHGGKLWAEGDVGKGATFFFAV